MVEGREAVDLHQLDSKVPRIQPIDPSHHRSKSKAAALQDVYMAIFFDQGNGLSKGGLG